MFTDSMARYLPEAQGVLQGDFSFNDVPLFIFIAAFWMLLFKGQILYIALKLTSFVFFLGILFLLPNLFKKLKLNRIEIILFLLLFLFSTWSLLLSVTILQDIMLAFFAIALFITIENYFKKPNLKEIILLIIMTSLMILTKLTGYFILAGFCLYILIKKGGDKKIKSKLKCLSYLLVGVIITLPWLIKNYINTGMVYVHSVTMPIYVHGLAEYVDYFIKFYHYFWEIPLPSKVALTGILSVGYNLYYVAALVTTIFISLLIIFSLIRYGKKYKQYILLTLPLFAFAFYWAFIIFWGPHDFGRYTFPLWPFLFFFLVRFISNLKNKQVKRFCYVFVVLFCILSIASAFGISIHMNIIDGQVVEISEKLKEENLENATIISNDHFTSYSLSYYLGKRVKFNLSENVIDTNVKCEGENLFSSRNFDVFKEDDEYRICRN